MINVQEKKSSRIYSFEEVEKMVADMGYIILKDTFVFYSKKFTVIDSQGYYYVMNGYNATNSQHPRAFGKENPFTINNIKHYIKINEIKTKLLSETYNGNNKMMLWECECGDKFERTWQNFYAGATCCLNCSARFRGEKRRISVNEITSLINERGYTLVDGIDGIVVSNNKFSVYNNEGYFYEINWNTFKQGKNPLKFHHSNPYSIQNINNFFKREINDEYECISDEYQDNMSLLTFVHKKCGHTFSVPWSYMQDLKYEPSMAYNRCSECNTLKKESHHASALKQVFLHEYPDTVVEEKSCRNPLTSRIMPTDIVNHRLKIAVEVQSSFHDALEKKKKDKIKRNFWIENGYQFYNPDIRNFSILEMIQLFFPYIDRMPDYVDFNFSNCIDFNKVQICLNEGLTIKETANILNLNEHSVRGLVTDKKVRLPHGYTERVYNIRAIIRLSKNGDFIKRYESINSLDRDGFANGTIRRVLAGKQDFSYDSFWVYENQYLSGDYVLPTIKEDKFITPVAKYDMNDNYVCSYATIYEAEENSVSSRGEIYRVAKGDRKSSRNEKWKFL